ncbi:hypothetical protein CLV92_105279 [Kineococcus xinjiangensis]|uniref:Uncharacterized protein n=1 Tax=Kineococcus xinjiangensis TaxID=512762 RepID=A0A2S6IPJ7_9ACTN|nr:hypothetical protein [Kineococcus xinjiangensis]PPK96177.1 hypothetical protein CLV92_105279 [Kineococcus xinjiangensis]
MSTAPRPPDGREPSGGRRLLVLGGVMILIVVALSLLATWAAQHG